MAVEKDAAITLLDGELPVRLSVLYFDTGYRFLLFIKKVGSGFASQMLLKRGDGSHAIRGEGKVDSIEEAEEKFYTIVHQLEENTILEMVDRKDLVFPDDCSSELFMSMMKSSDVFNIRIEK